MHRRGVTFETGAQFLGQHTLDDTFCVDWHDHAYTHVHFFLIDGIVCASTGLEDVDCSSHVSLGKFEESFFPCRGDVDGFSVDDVV